MEAAASLVDNLWDCLGNLTCKESRENYCRESSLLFRFAIAIPIGNGFFLENIKDILFALVSVGIIGSGVLFIHSRWSWTSPAPW